MPRWTETDEEATEHKARTCLALSISPTEYDAMTVRELNIWLRVYEDMTRER